MPCETWSPVCIYDFTLTSIAFMRACGCKWRIPRHTLNDGEQSPQVTDWRSLRTRAIVYEVLVRRLLTRSASPPALLFLNWDRIGWCANMDATPVYVQRLAPGSVLAALRGVPWLATPQIAVDTVARWYGLPSLAPRNALYHRDCEDVRFRGAFCESGGTMGCGHLRPLGYRVVARVITTYLDEASRRVERERDGGLRGRRATTGFGPAKHADMNGRTTPAVGISRTALRDALRDAPVASSSGGVALPPPLLDELLRLQSTGAARCVRGEIIGGLSRTVVHGDWAFVLRDPRQPPGAEKPGILSLSAPSTLLLTIGDVPAGVVMLGFLRSYDDRMGELHVACARGCTCTGVTLGGWHARRSSVIAFGQLDNVSMSPTPTLEGCTLRLDHVARSLAPRHASSKGDRAGAIDGSRLDAASRPGPRGGNASSPGASLARSSTSKFKLLAVIMPPFVVSRDDRDLVTARGWWMTT